MRDLDNEKAIVDLFDTIDNIRNDNDENDTIVTKIKKRFCNLFCSYLDRQKEKKQLKAMVHKYEEHLFSFQEVIRSQLSLLNSFWKRPDQDITVGTLLNLKNELDSYSIKFFSLNYIYMSKLLNQNTANIYTYIQIHDFLEKYYGNIKEQYTTIKQTEQIQPISTDWKNIFYMTVDVRNQSQFSKSLISNYITGSNGNIDNKFFIEQSNFHTADFQAHLSKSIFYQRKRLHLTQTELSNRSGVDRTMIAKIEKVNQKSTLETAVKLLSALNLRLVIYPTLENNQRDTL